VLSIVWDDGGFSALEPIGGLPNMRRIADPGLRHTQFHTSALCSSTRSCLLNGRNATSNAMACITEASAGFPGSPVHAAGGVIKQVIVDVSGDPYADLEQEAIGAFAREEVNARR
jgi:arylsulfatase